MRALFLVLTVAFPGTLLAQEPLPEGTAHYVDNLRECEGLVPCYATIMDAVIAAVPYDSIRVFPGVYREAVVFDRTKNSIVLQAHHRALMPVIAAPTVDDNAVTLDAAGVQVLNFVLESEGGAGVRNLGPNQVRDGATDTVIQGNLVRASRGIVFFGCRRSKVINNSVLGGGITIDSGDTRECSIEGNAVDGASIRTGGVCTTKTDNVIRRNIVRGGGISLLCGDPLLRNTVESNRVESGSISLNAFAVAETNIIRRNVVRGGGIALTAQSWTLQGNTIEFNFVSGSAGDGIALRASGCGAAPNFVRKNTSVENAGCDINDFNAFPVGGACSNNRNSWMGNRFATKCGAATG
jgi:hypothetical protein